VGSIYPIEIAAKPIKILGPTDDRWANCWVSYEICKSKNHLLFPIGPRQAHYDCENNCKANSRTKQTRAVQKVERIMYDSSLQSSVRSIHSMGLARLCRLALLARPLACELEASRSRFRGAWLPSSSFTSDFISSISRCIKSTWRRERVSAAIHLQLCQAFLF
jgi:hypothetical protein